MTCLILDNMNAKYLADDKVKQYLDQFRERNVREEVRACEALESGRVHLRADLFTDRDEVFVVSIVSLLVHTHFI